MKHAWREKNAELFIRLWGQQKSKTKVAFETKQRSNNSGRVSARGRFPATAAGDELGLSPNEDRDDSGWMGDVRGAEKQEGRSSLCEGMYDSSNPRRWGDRFVSAGLNWLSQLPRTSPSHGQPDHIPPVIWTRGAGEGKCNYRCLFVCHLCHVWRWKHRAALVVITLPPPKLIFYFHNNRLVCVCTVLLPEAHEIVRIALYYML